MAHQTEFSAFNTKCYVVAHLGILVPHGGTPKFGQNGNHFSVDACASGEDMKTQDNKTNSFRLRVYDDELLTALYALADNGKFSSMNELLNRALTVGVKQMKEGDKRQIQSEKAVFERSDDKLNELNKKVKDVSVTVDDIFVMMNVMEMLVSTLYNAELMRVKNEAVSSELIESGYLSSLPDYIQRVKDSLIKRFMKKE